MRSLRVARLLLVLSLLVTACGGAPRPSAAPCPPLAPPGVVAPSEAPASVRCAPAPEPLTGTLCLPAVAVRGERRRGVVLFGGAQGGDPMAPYARALAERGFVALSVVYFGTPATTRALVNVPVETAGLALHALLARSEVLTSGVAVLGSSKGGEYALLVAATYPEVSGVVALAPAPFAWFGLGQGGIPAGCSWSHGGEPLPCVPRSPAADADAATRFSAREPVRFRASYDLSLADEGAVRAAFFPLEHLKGPLLCLAGDDDQLWSSRLHCELALTYLHEHHHAYADRMLSFPGAGHLFFVAERGPAAAINTVDLGSFSIAFGGSPDADSDAARRTWSEIDTFLRALP